MSSTARRVLRITGLPARISGSMTIRSDSGTTAVYNVAAAVLTPKRAVEGGGVSVLAGRRVHSVFHHFLARAAFEVAVEANGGAENAAVFFR